MIDKPGDDMYNDGKMIHRGGSTMFSDFCNRIGFPAEATAELKEIYEKMSQDPEVVSMWDNAQKSLFTFGDSEHLKILEEVAKYTGVHPYTADMVFLVRSGINVRPVYEAQGLSENQYWDNMEDLRYKLMECWNLHGIWGTFVTSWFQRFFLCDRYKLGRLQYEKPRAVSEDVRNYLKKDRMVLACHIPSSGPLTPELVMDSLKKAYAFFKDEFEDGIMVLTTQTWMLYPPHYEVFPENSNLRRFYDLFKVIASYERENNSDFIRIFNRVFDREKLDTMPAETTLQKNFLKFFKDGNCMGVGCGVLFFDGEEIIG